MSKIQAETIGKDLTERLNQLYAASPQHVEIDDFEYRRMLRDCDSLIKVDAVEGYVARGLAHVLTANVEELEKDISKARAISSSAGDFCDFMLAQGLAKLGFFSRAQKLFVSSAQPALGKFGHRSKLGLAVGAMIALSDMFEEAEAMNLTFSSAVEREELESMASVMRDARVTDTDIAAMMDYLGIVARRHGLKIKHQDMGVRRLDGERFVHIEAKVDCSANEAADMIYEVAELVAEAERVPPAIHVSFGVV